MRIKEIKYGQGTIRIMNDSKENPEEIKKTIDRISKIVMEYYRRNMV